MKKIVSKAIVAVLAVLMAVSFVSCSSKYKTMEEYVNSSEVQDQISSLKEEVQNSGMNFELKGEGDKLIYVYTIDSAYVVDGLGEQLEAALTEEASTFEQVAEELKKEVAVKNPIVVVQYIDSDGNEIHVQEFTAK